MSIHAVAVPPAMPVTVHADWHRSPTWIDDVRHPPLLRMLKRPSAESMAWQ
jgi:hypothetical protein